MLLILWVGSLWSLAVWVAPALFYWQPDQHLAGVFATRFFCIETYLGAAVALLALILPGRLKFMPGFIAVAILSINEWVLKPFMILAHTQGVVRGLSFGAWHGVSAVLYVIACLCALLLVWKNDFR